MRIASGVTDQYLNFVAVDITDLKTRETGLTTFTVYRSRNGGTATAMTTPTVAELDATNMPGVYTLLLDEDMTIGAGNLTEEIAYHITQASMAPVTRVIELFAPANYTIGTVTTLTGHTAQTGDTYALANGATGFAAIDTVVDGIQTDLSNGTDGLGAIKAETALIVADTNELQTDWADGGRLDLIVDATLVDTATTIPATISTAQADLDTLTGADGAIIASAQTVATVTDVTNEVTADITKISGSATAADNLEASALGIHSTTVSSSASATSVVLTAGSTVDDTYIGRILVVTSGTNAGEATDITDYTGSSKTLTVTALTSALTGSDAVVIV